MMSVLNGGDEYLFDQKIAILINKINYADLLHLSTENSSINYDATYCDILSRTGVFKLLGQAPPPKFV